MLVSLIGFGSIIKSIRETVETFNDSAVKSLNGILVSMDN